MPTTVPSVNKSSEVNWNSDCDEVQVRLKESERDDKKRRSMVRVEMKRGRGE
jgi:hypothetical protein